MAVVTKAQLENASRDADDLGAVVNGSIATVVTTREGGQVDSLARAIDGIKAFNYRGAWATTTSYALKDVVISGGIAYVAVLAHTSGTFATDLAAGRWEVHQGLTASNTATLTNKSFSGAVAFTTNGSRIGITSDGSPISPQALVNIVNNDASTNGLRVTSYWTGTTGAPYQNNDNSLWEVFNDIQSTSLNRSWSGSFPNAYNKIPNGVYDSGTRNGLIGWATSVAHMGYIHAGTLERQTGVEGNAGYQGSGSASTALINYATGVQGNILNESTGATITNARAGEFITTSSGGINLNNVAVYASATNGTIENWSFYGNAGRFFNTDQALFGSITTQCSANVVSRDVGNLLEFGHPDPTGYVSNLGATNGAGYPFLALCCEAGTGNTYTTRGKLGTVIYNDLAGALVFARTPANNTANQALSEMARFTAAGQLTLLVTPTAPFYAVGGVQVIGPRGAAVADIAVSATTGTLPTANGTVVIANAATPTVVELLEYCRELEATLEALLARVRTHGLIS